MSRINSKEQRRQNPEFRDGRLQVFKRGRVDDLARLIRVGPQIGDGKLVEIAFFVLRGCKCHGRPPLIISFPG